MDNTHRILLDFDSTISDLTRAQLAAIKEKFGVQYHPSDIKDWGWTGIPKEHQDYVWGLFYTPEFHATPQPVEDALEGIQLMRDRGYFMEIVSDRPMNLYDSTRAWLDSQGLDDLELIFTHSPHAKSKAGADVQTKADIIRRDNLNIVVEDAPHHAEVLSQIPEVDAVYLLDYPYNAHIETGRGTKIHRMVSRWDELNSILHHHGLPSREELRALHSGVVYA